MEAQALLCPSMAFPPFSPLSTYADGHRGDVQFFSISGFRIPDSLGQGGQKWCLEYRPDFILISSATNLDQSKSQDLLNGSHSSM